MDLEHNAQQEHYPTMLKNHNKYINHIVSSHFTARKFYVKTFLLLAK